MESGPDQQNAFLELIEQHGGILHRVRHLYAMDPEDGKDLVQEILMQLWRAFPSYRGEAAISTWMYRVALNTAPLRRRTARARTRESNDPEALAALAVGPNQPDPDVRHLYRCIRQLPSLNRAIVLLHLEGHSYEEIARTIGVSHNPCIQETRWGLSSALAGLGRPDDGVGAQASSSTRSSLK